MQIRQRIGFVFLMVLEILGLSVVKYPGYELPLIKNIDSSTCSINAILCNYYM